MALINDKDLLFTQEIYGNVRGIPVCKGSNYMNGALLPFVRQAHSIKIKGFAKSINKNAKSKSKRFVTTMHKDV
jgi:hypothetical protein